MRGKPDRNTGFIYRSAYVDVEIIHNAREHDKTNNETRDHVFIICVLIQLSDRNIHNYVINMPVGQDRHFAQQQGSGIRLLGRTYSESPECSLHLRQKV